MTPTRRCLAVCFTAALTDPAAHAAIAASRTLQHTGKGAWWSATDAASAGSFATVFARGEHVVPRDDARLAHPPQIDEQAAGCGSHGGRSLEGPSAGGNQAWRRPVQMLARRSERQSPAGHAAHAGGGGPRRRAWPGVDAGACGRSARVSPGLPATASSVLMDSKDPRIDQSGGLTQP